MKVIDNILKTGNIETKSITISISISILNSISAQNAIRNLLSLFTK